jgi:membrane-bound lytic murein transglycosylase
MQQSKAKHSTAQHSTAQHSTAQHSTAQHSTAQHSKAKQSKAMQSKAKQSNAKQSNAMQSKAMQSKAKQSKAKQSKAKQSKAKQSKAKQSMQHNTTQHNTTQHNTTQQLQCTFVSGESSSGKSSFLNLILGEELLPHHVLNATSTICELKYGKVRELVVHYKYDKDQRIKPPSTTFPLQTEEECGDTYQKQIASFVYLDQKEREKGSDYDKVELFWPHELLQVYLP